MSDTVSHALNSHQGISGRRRRTPLARIPKSDQARWSHAGPASVSMASCSTSRPRRRCAADNESAYNAVASECHKDRCRCAGRSCSSECPQERDHAQQPHTPQWSVRRFGYGAGPPGLSCDATHTGHRRMIPRLHRTRVRLHRISVTTWFQGLQGKWLAQGCGRFPRAVPG